MTYRLDSALRAAFVPLSLAAAVLRRASGRSQRAASWWWRYGAAVSGRTNKGVNPMIRLCVVTSAACLYAVSASASDRSDILAMLTLWNDDDPAKAITACAND